ncbi:MAG: alpha-1,6-glucosidase domain-containing protein [Pseudomonadota bacterium]
MFTKMRLWRAAFLVVGGLTLAGCGGSGVESGTNELLTCDVPNVPNESGTACVPPPPIQCDAPTVPNETNDACVVGADPALPAPVFTPSDNQAVLYYNRASVDADNSSGDPAYEGWRLHTWNNDTCDAYADPDTDWANGRVHTGVDPNYGAYWVLDLKDGYGDCHNFIIHKGTDDAGKEMGGGDFKGSLIQDDETFTRMNFTLSGEPTVFEFPILSLGPQAVDIEGFGAHWLDSNTILWDVPESVVDVKLHYSAQADLETSLDDGINGTSIGLVETSLSEAQAASAPHLSAMTAWQGDWSTDDAKTVLTTQAVVGGYDAEGTLVAATGIQIANALDALYTSGDNDADEAMFGAIYTGSGITVALWAPTASNVDLLLYNASKSLTERLEMTRDDSSGVWRYEGDMSLDRQLYRYEITVYHPVTGNIETLLVTDPYSVSLSTNGRFSRFVNLADEDLKPEGWDTHDIPTIENPEDAVIYEGHIRDFSVRDMSTSEANRGKYLAFTEEGTAPVEHLQKLVDAGLNYFHILPASDIATIDESPSSTIDLYDTVGALCRLNSNAAVCEEENASTLLIDVYNSYDPLAQAAKAQALTNDLRGVDTFNWGYDPHHFNAPEGSYASSAEGVERIIEMRAMIQALHEMGLRVALDVVYNHTNASGVFSKSVLDKVVPGYYHRYETDTGAIVRETCCDDTEPRNIMMEKFMEDSLLIWTEHYKYDAFRFDIMSQATKDTMIRLRDAVQMLDEDNYFYGEGWTKIDRGYEQANQLNMAGTEIGTFNDRIREAIRQGNIFNPESDSLLYDQDRVKMGMIGTLKDYVLETSAGSAGATSNLGGYAEDPADIINYVSKHDNETLWDQLNYTLPQDISLQERVRAQNVAMGINLVSQGIPFLQMGGDMLRSKSMDRNTYDSGDWFNYVDFTYQTNNWNVGLPLAQDNEGRWAEMGEFIYDPERAASMADITFASDVFAELLAIRMSSPLFRLTTSEQIIDRIGFHNIGARQQRGLIAMSIDDGLASEGETPREDLDMLNDAVMVLVNTGYEEKSITVNTATGFTLHAMQVSSVDEVVRSASFTEGEDGNGIFTVPAMTIAVFVKPQTGAQGYGLSAFATSGAPDVVPYGDTTAYLRGDMNGWSTDDAFTYRGNGIYQVAVALEASTTYAFKFASENWDTINFGAADGDSGVVVENEEKVLARTNTNLSFTPSISATYLFIVDASDNEAPILTIDNEEPYVGTSVFLRGAMNGWGTDEEFVYQGTRVYTFARVLSPGTYEFKVASEDWSTVNFGALSNDDADRNIAPGQTLSLGRTNDNMVLTIEEEDRYVFVFDVDDPDSPTIGVFKEAYWGDTDVYVRGGMNGWGAVDRFSYQGDGIYTAELELSAGSVEFKVASEDWSTVNLGNPNDADSNVVTIGETKILGASNNNLMLEVAEAGLYEFKVTGPDGNSPMLSVTKQ